MKKGKLLKKLKALESKIETLTDIVKDQRDTIKFMFDDGVALWDKVNDKEHRLCELESLHYPSDTDKDANELQKTLPFDDTEIPKQVVSIHNIKGKIAIMGIGDDAKRSEEISDKFKS